MRFALGTTYTQRLDLGGQIGALCRVPVTVDYQYYQYYSSLSAHYLRRSSWLHASSSPYAKCSIPLLHSHLYSHLYSHFHSLSSAN